MYSPFFSLKKRERPCFAQPPRPYNLSVTNLRHGFGLHLLTHRQFAKITTLHSLKNLHGRDTPEVVSCFFKAVELLLQWLNVLRLLCDTCANTQTISALAR